VGGTPPCVIGFLDHFSKGRYAVPMVVSHDKNCHGLNIFDSCVVIFPSPIYGAFQSFAPGRAFHTGKHRLWGGGDLMTHYGGEGMEMVKYIDVV